VIDELRRRLDRIKSESEELEAAVEWFDEQAARPNIDRAALRAICVRLKTRTSELKEEIADFERDLG
jgi:predicted nuclease with TOPRIM domain